MKRLIMAATATLAILFTSPPAAVHAEEMALGEHRNGGLGFHNIEAPIGVRWWFAGQKVGVDLGLGFASTPAPSYSDEQLTGWTIEVGVPFVIQSWSRAHIIVRPGLLYDSQQFEATSPPTPFDTEDGTTFVVTGEIEAEVFLVDNFSVSASHGIGFASFDPPGGGDSITSFSTFGNNFTNIGFHVYFFGGSE
jgi:hypothetical protein